jgi:hypothetical protein
VSFGRDLPGHLVRREKGFRKSLTLQNLFVHVPIALLDTGISAPQIDCNSTAGPAGRGVKPNHAAFDRKPSVHGVEDGP